MEEKEIVQIQREKILLGPTIVVCHPSIQKLCLCPYFNHPKGCPNYGRKTDCPPQVDYFPKTFRDEVYIVAIIFNFEDYLNLKRVKHPDWTERALRNPRHWQGHLRSELKKFVLEIFNNNNARGEVLFNPEAMGVNVTKTCKNAGLKLEWPPQKVVCQIALIGQKR